MKKITKQNKMKKRTINYFLSHYTFIYINSYIYIIYNNNKIIKII